MPKSIPSPPDSLLTNPLNISVVEFPSILGPTIVNIVLPIANINTIINIYNTNSIININNISNMA